MPFFKRRASPVGLRASRVTREKKGIHPLHACTMVFVLAAVVYWIVIRVGKGSMLDP